MLSLNAIHLDHKTTLKILGLAILIGLGLGIGLFQAYGGKSFVETLYEIFILAIGGLGAIALQMIIWPERFLPKPQTIQASNFIATIEQKPIDNLRTFETKRFESELRPNQRFFRRGDPVLFVAKFNGKLVNGYIAASIKKPDGTIEGQFDYSTVANTSMGIGKLNGEHIVTENYWHWIIPKQAHLAFTSFTSTRPVTIRNHHGWLGKKGDIFAGETAIERTYLLATQVSWRVIGIEWK